jgi:hypothetical protein
MEDLIMDDLRMLIKIFSPIVIFVAAVLIFLILET